MKAVITGETEELIGVNLRDNNEIEHVIDVGKDNGVISGHQQDGYPDKPAKRTTEEHEWVNQARRFARFYVYRQRGYDTVDSLANTDRIAMTAMTIANLPDNTFEEYFGDFYQQMRHDAGEADSLLTVPDLPSTTVPRVEQDIYLGLDSDSVASLLDQLVADGALEAIVSAVDQDGGGLLTRVQRVFVDEEVDVTATAETFSEDVIDTLGPLTVRWARGDEDEEISRSAGKEVPNRDPDARPQLFGRAYDFDDIQAFRRSLVRHLLCQVRDCYITMGIAPPEDVRIQGPGFYDHIGWYSNHDFYEDYHDPSATITDWQEAQTPDDAYEMPGLLD